MSTCQDRKAFSSEFWLGMGFLGGVVFTLLIIATIFFWLRWVTQRRAAAARELEDDVEALPRSAAAAREVEAARLAEETIVYEVGEATAAARELEAALETVVGFEVGESSSRGAVTRELEAARRALVFRAAAGRELEAARRTEETVVYEVGEATAAVQELDAALRAREMVVGETSSSDHLVYSREELEFLSHAMAAMDDVEFGDDSFEEQ
jgi:hypothetical protein